MTTSNFEKELEQLINKHSIENGSNTPDFILSKYVMNCIENFNLITAKRENWYGRNPEEKPDVGSKINIKLDRTNSSIEKIAKYCYYLNTKFNYPYFFRFSYPTNHYEDSIPGVINDIGYASFYAGRHFNYDKVEVELFFGSINSIVNTNAPLRYLLDKKGEVEIDLSNQKTITSIKNAMDYIFHTESGLKGALNARH